jgi:ABC-2 type transport system permease protein
VSAEPLPVERLGKPIKGPSALGSDPVRFWHLTRALAVTDFKLKFFGSALGYLWQLMKPLMMFGILLVVFTRFVGLSDGVRFYSVALLLGIVLYTFLNEATSGALTSLVERESLVRKIEFPRLAVPLSVVVGALFNLGLNLCVVVIFLLAEGGSIRWTWFELPVLVVLLAGFATGLGMLLSAWFVRYRDVKPIWEVILQALFYASPIFYAVSTVSPAWLRTVMMCNPFAAIVQQARYALIDPSHQSAAAAIGGLGWLLIPIGIGLVVLIGGFRVFDRAAPRIAEDL